MITMTLAQIINIVAGSLKLATSAEPINTQTQITNISIDSRNISPDSLFIAIQGESFDGHNFVANAHAAGAVAVIVARPVADNIPQIIVPDPKHALGLLGAFVRDQVNTKIVALTGSSGKTSVKEMTAAILRQCGQTLSTHGNFNNDIGVPLTLLRLTPQDEYAVIELGANHLGEIAYTSQLVKPDSALINNIAAAHLAGFGSLAGVAQAKGEIFLGLTSTGTAIINLDFYNQLDAYSWQHPSLKHVHCKHRYTFSATVAADFYGTDIIQSDVTHFRLHTPQGGSDIMLPLCGMHNVANAIAAAALAMSVGANLEQVKQGLAQIKPVKGRLYPIKLNQTQTIIDDSYNANMGSMLAAIKFLQAQSGYRVLVVGDMAELGNDAANYHQMLGQEVQKTTINCVVSVGELSALISQHSGVGHHFNSKEPAIIFLKQLLSQEQNMTLLVKGSRSAKMEQLIEQLNSDQD